MAFEDHIHEVAGHRGCQMDLVGCPSGVHGTWTLCANGHHDHPTDPSEVARELWGGEEKRGQLYRQPFLRDLAERLNGRIDQTRFWICWLDFVGGWKVRVYWFVITEADQGLEREEDMGNEWNERVL